MNIIISQKQILGGTLQGGNSSGTNVSNGSNQVIEWNSDGFTIKGNSSTSGSINQRKIILDQLYMQVMNL